MDTSNFKCFKIFSAIQYFPYVERIQEEMKKYELLSYYLEFFPRRKEDFHEFRVIEMSTVDDNGKIILKPIPLGEIPNNIINFRSDRIEINQIISEENKEDTIYERIGNLYKIHDELYYNEATKFGLVKFYEINGDKEELNDIFSLKDKYEGELQNTKSFILVKRSNYNINIEFIIEKDLYILRIDINDIIELKNIFQWDHFQKIVDLHNNLLNKEIINIFGGKNG